MNCSFIQVYVDLFAIAVLLLGLALACYGQYLIHYGLFMTSFHINVHTSQKIVILPFSLTESYLLQLYIVNPFLTMKAYGHFSTCVITNDLIHHSFMESADVKDRCQASQRKNWFTKSYSVWHYFYLDLQTVDDGTYLWESIFILYWSTVLGVILYECLQ